MKQPVEDRNTGAIEFGFSDAEIFEELGRKNKEPAVELCPNYFGTDGCHRDGCNALRLGIRDPRQCSSSPLYEKGLTSVFSRGVA